ncbi:MAG: GTPase HflX, partial [Bacteroidales bacterium]|nr:GTPase HflX [Bacteroidales bacterium]
MLDKKETLALQSAPEKAVFVSVVSPNQSEHEINEYLDELRFLAETAGVEEDARFVQRLDRPNPKTYLGTGRLEDLVAYLKAREINLAVFDDELSPSQLRNINKALGCKILDRTNLILDIFAQRAQTA